MPTRPRRGRARSDLAVYVVIALLIWSAWRISLGGWFTAGDDTGYWIGVVGGSMLLALFLYPLRKHLRWARNWGRMNLWLWVHMALGIGGSWLILVHSTFRVGSLNAAVALYSMLVVALSGVVGRFIHRHVNKGLRGEEITLHELQRHAGMHKDEAHTGLRFAPNVQQRLSAFEQSALHTDRGALRHLRSAFWLPVLRRREQRACSAELERCWAAPAAQRPPSERQQAHKLVHAYLDAVVGVAQFTAYARLFALWHVAHIPFVYLLVVSALVHVLAVHAY